MTESSNVWDGVLTGDAVQSPYSASEWAARQDLLQGIGSTFANYGVISGSGDGTYNPLQVNAKSPASTNIEIEIGAALVNGRLYQNTSALTLPVGANVSGNPRIDTVVLRADFVAQTIRAVIKQGTPAVSPARVAMQQDATIWEIPLADIAVANGFVTITTTNISERQRSVQSLTMGWLPYAAPLNYVWGGTYNASSVVVAVGNGLAMPIYLGANMLIQDLVVRQNGGAVNTTCSWGLYKQDLNDGNASEKMLRLVVAGGGNSVLGGSGNLSFPAVGVPQVIEPGLYWLVFLVTNTAVSVGRTGVSNGLEDHTTMRNTTVAFTIAQMLDLTSGFTAESNTYGMLLRGRVFGQTTVF